nr:tracheary element differentiation-related 6 [Tanacetum cinerariifolium]
ASNSFTTRCFFLKRRVSKTEMVHVDEHLKVSENVLQGPNRKAVSITIDDDLHIDEEEEYRKNENFG